MTHNHDHDDVTFNPENVLSKVLRKNKFTIIFMIRP